MLKRKLVPLVSFNSPYLQAEPSRINNIIPLQVAEADEKTLISKRATLAPSSLPRQYCSSPDLLLNLEDGILDEELQKSFQEDETAMEWASFFEEMPEEAREELFNFLHEEAIPSQPIVEESSPQDLTDAQVQEVDNLLIFLENELSAAHSNNPDLQEISLIKRSIATTQPTSLGQIESRGKNDSHSIKTKQVECPPESKQALADCWKLYKSKGWTQRAFCKKVLQGVFSQAFISRLQHGKLGERCTYHLVRNDPLVTKKNREILDCFYQLNKNGMSQRAFCAPGNPGHGILKQSTLSVLIAEDEQKPANYGKFQEAQQIQNDEELFKIVESQKKRTHNYWPADHPVRNYILNQLIKSRQSINKFTSKNGLGYPYVVRKITSRSILAKHLKNSHLSTNSNLSIKGRSKSHTIGELKITHPPTTNSLASSIEGEV